MIDPARIESYRQAAAQLESAYDSLALGERTLAERAYVAGMYWCRFELAGTDALRERAEQCTSALQDDVASLTTSTRGDSVVASHWACVQLTRSKDVKRQLVAAGEALAEQFQHRGKYFAIEDDSTLLAVESLLATPLVFYVANETLEQELGRRATQHARTARKVLVADDGSVYPSAQCDAATGTFVKSEVETNSHAALASAMQGFVRCYSIANQSEFLHVAEHVADRWLDGSSRSVAAEDEWVAMLASALRDLAQQTREAEKAAIYRAEAYRLIDQLVGHVGTTIPAAQRTISADYYLLRSLTRVILDDESRLD